MSDGQPQQDLVEWLRCELAAHQAAERRLKAELEAARGELLNRLSELAAKGVDITIRYRSRGTTWAGDWHVSLDDAECCHVTLAEALAGALGDLNA